MLILYLNLTYSLFSFLKDIYLFTSLAALGLSYSTWDLKSSLWPKESLVAACGILFPEQGLNPGALHWEHGVLSTSSWLFLRDKRRK